ncbi:hypothetical protein HDU89_003446 [Geranomyces variabilis]|nr:hypothetical protein HDU89_003446 [Geranomyces variabilis]
MTVVAVTVNAPSAHGEPPAAMWEAIEAKTRPNKTLPLEEYMQKYDMVAGFALAVLNNGKIDWTKYCGVRKADAADDLLPVDASTQFQVASVSKPVTAVAVLRLVDAGMLDLDVDVNTYLKRWKLTVPAGTVITLRLLLSHRAGVNVDSFPGYARSNSACVARIPKDVVGILDGLGNTLPVVVDSVPGFERYSGGGYTIIQCLLEDVCGKSFHQLMSEWVLSPCGMDNSTFRLADLHPPSDNYASGHPFCHASVSGDYLAYPEGAAAGLWTTAVDLAKFSLALARAIRPVVGGKEVEKLASAEQGEDSSLRLLSPAAVKEMLTIPGVTLDEATDKNPSEKRMALGINRSGHGSRMRLSHGGGNLGFITTMEFCPHGGFGYVLLFNGHCDCNHMRMELGAALAQVHNWPSSDPKKDIQPDKLTKVDGDGSVAHFARMAGTYRAEDGCGSRIEVSADGMSCAFSPFAMGPFPLKRESKERFVVQGLARGGPTTLEFKFGDDAAQAAFEVDFAGPDVHFTAKRI